MHCKKKTCKPWVRTLRKKGAQLRQKEEEEEERRILQGGRSLKVGGAAPMLLSLVQIFLSKSPLPCC
jgi:hypothetical protein